MEDFLTSVVNQINKAFSLLNYEKEFLEYFIKPERIISFKIPLKTDDKKLKVLEGYRVQHNSILGPYKGGIRFDENLTLNDDIALAILMTLKNSLNNLPYGGAKGGVKVNPKLLSINELERLSRLYVDAVSDFIGSDIDIPAPDIGTNSQIMAWMVDEYSKIFKRNVPASFTGKPKEFFGNPFREYSTGYGLALITHLASEKFLDKKERIKASLHGFGNVGQNFALYSKKFGIEITAISDSSGTIYDENGIDVKKAIEIKNSTGKIIDYPNIKKTSDPNYSLFLDCDILVPASRENVITKENVKKIKARLIVEGANGPVESEAEKELYKNKDFYSIIPDILANAGGVITSYIEWQEDITWQLEEEDVAISKLEKIMKNNFGKAFDFWKSKFSHETFRTACIAMALDRIYKAAKIRAVI